MRLHHLLILLTHPEWEGYYINLDLHHLIPVYPCPLASAHHMIMTSFKPSGTQIHSIFSLILLY